MATSGEHAIVAHVWDWIAGVLSAIVSAVVLAAGGMTIRNARRIAEHETRLNAIQDVGDRLDKYAAKVDRILGRLEQQDADRNRRGLP